MAFIIDSNVLMAINRLTAEHLRSQVRNIMKHSDSDAADSKFATSGLRPAGVNMASVPAMHFSREEIRNALMLAKKMNAPNAETMQTLGGIPAADDEHAAMK